MGGIFAALAAMFVGVAGELDNPELQDAINNIQVTDNTGYNYDYDSFNLDGDEYNIGFDFDDEDELLDLESRALPNTKFTSFLRHFSISLIWIQEPADSSM